MISCILVDDNKMARMALAQIISQVTELQLVAECETAMEAYNVLQTNPVDVVFLDIEMPGISGLELAKQLKGKATQIIFTTGKSDYALDAFELNIVDYLMKPVSLARFLQAIEKVKELKGRQKAHAKSELDFFFVKDKGILKKIKPEDILYLEAMGDYVKIFTGEKSYLVHSTLKVLEQKLPASDFLRVHRSFIIALKKIDSIDDGVIKIQQNSIPVADAYRAVLNQKIKLL